MHDKRIWVAVLSWLPYPACASTTGVDAAGPAARSMAARSDRPHKAPNNVGISTTARLNHVAVPSSVSLWHAWVMLLVFAAGPHRRCCSALPPHSAPPARGRCCVACAARDAACRHVLATHPCQPTLRSQRHLHSRPLLWAPSLHNQALYCKKEHTRRVGQARSLGRKRYRPLMRMRQPLELLRIQPYIRSQSEPLPGPG